ncbi:MAG: inorganic phosphate transporter [Spirochaetes bacterium]|nr:inorganic phosphate transporter [Spirochaetota bacterium]
MELIFVSLTLLAILAVGDLIVGVSNDAVNFLNSSVGSRVVKRKFIYLIAAMGILAGVTFSSGMMEIARKGIFQPEHFSLFEILMIFTAVMLADIILLDYFNTYGLPTSTTVSVIFELLGASIAISILKIISRGENLFVLSNYINTAKVLAILSGILSSVAIAFVVGVVVQFISRMIFTFNYKTTLKRYGGLWGGIGMASIVYFILIKGAKGTSFLTASQISWIENNALVILITCFCASFFIFQFILLFTSLNIFKPIILVGTFALAMAFAANDLVNFIGVPLAGFTAYNYAQGHIDPLNSMMKALNEPVQTNTLILLSAGIVMALTLFLSRKARTVTRTEVDLSRQEEGIERFESFFLAQFLVMIGTNMMDFVKKIFPQKILHTINKRKDMTNYEPHICSDGEIPAFDLVRASVNMIASSALISLATSYKLPLSTTYVTFMVAMGSSLADGAWDRESAVYRISGVLTVIGGWFFTALSAFVMSFVFCLVLYYFKIYGIIVLSILTVAILWKNHHRHKSIQEETSIEVYNLRKIKDHIIAVKTSFEQTGILLENVSALLQKSFNGLRSYDRVQLRIAKNNCKKIQTWTNIIIANIFKTLRLLHQCDIKVSKNYSQLITNLQEIAESQRDITIRSYHHVINNHKGLLEIQVKELSKVISTVCEMLNITSENLKQDKLVDLKDLKTKFDNFSNMIHEFDEKQIQRVQNETSKTRLSILYYAYLVNSMKIITSTKNLLETFNESLKIKELQKN